MSFQGRGRGKRRNPQHNNPNPVNLGAWSSGAPKNVNKNNIQNENIKARGERKFEEACKEINESVQKYIATHNLYEEDVSDEDDNHQMEEDKVLARVLNKYDENEKLGRTHQFLQDAFKAGALVCLICIENIKKIDPVSFLYFYLTCLEFILL